ncbi:MAG TPA: hypothetical protein VIK39_10600 [Candidatus Angelobacter sp.]
MSQESDKALADLHQLFPIRARLLTTHLKEANGRLKKFEEWRERQIVNFIEMLALNAADLERAYVENRTSTLAYTARNLLELSIWVDYCNLSNTHAKAFWDDVARDLFGLSKAIQAIAVQETGAEIAVLTKAQDRMTKFANAKFGIKNLADDFKRVAKAAEELGREKSFVARNKAFSKFAHPTAWAVNSVLSGDADKDIREMFLLDGVELAMNSIIRTRKFILEHFPAPPNIPIS